MSFRKILGLVLENLLVGKKKGLVISKNFLIHREKNDSHFEKKVNKQTSA